MTTAPASVEERFLLESADWNLYESILSNVGDRHVFVTFDRGRLELMTPSRVHDRRSRLLSKVIDFVAEELMIPVHGAGSFTFRRKSVARGLEADQWFYVVHTPAIVDKDEIDPETDPPPDLAVEVEISTRLLDRVGIYAAMGVPELWRDDGVHVRMFRLGSDRLYTAIAHSLSFPVLAPEHVETLLALAKGLDDTSWSRVVREWIRTTLAPR